jgi:hypothetical protein
LGRGVFLAAFGAWEEVLGNGIADMFKGIGEVIII